MSATDPLQALLASAPGQRTPFPVTSRYHGLPTATVALPDGRTVTHVRRRFLPALDSLAVAAEHVVDAADRIDTLAARYLGDPEQFWRVCDGNLVQFPWELTDVPGATVRVTLPAGIPGATGV